MKYLLPIIIIATMLAANYYVLYRIWNMLPSVPALRPVVTGIGVLALAAVFVSILAGDALAPGFTTVLYKVGTSWLVIMLYLLMAFAALDLLRVTHLLPVDKIMYHSWIGIAGMTVLMTGIFVAANYNYHDKKRVEFTVDTGGRLSRSYRIAMASDLHLGYGNGQGELNEWVQLINAEQPDLVLFVGDVIDNSVQAVNKMRYALRELNPEFGVFAVAGNHEYIAGVKHSLEFLEKSGMEVLRDGRILVNGDFYVVGRDDATNPQRMSVAQLLANAKPGVPVILLDHQPSQTADAIAAGVALQLSGHTHHGQVWPLNWVTNAIYPNSYGMMEKDNTKIYVSSGLGIWGGKFRIGTRSEYVIINLI